MSDIRLIEKPLTREELQAVADERFGEMVKAVVDVEKGVMAINAEWHAHIQAFLLAHGSERQNLWGLNLYPAKSFPDMVQFTSMINIRPDRGNLTRKIEAEGLQQQILEVVKKYIQL